MFTDAEIKSYANDTAAPRRCAAARSISSRDAIALAFGSTARLRRVLRLSGGRSSRAVFLVRASASRSQGQRSAAAVAELGAVPALGKRPLQPICGWRYFSISPFLGGFKVSSPRKRDP